MMERFTFDRSHTLLTPNSAVFAPPTDSKGRELTPEQLISRMGKICEKWETTQKRPVPIADQKFVNWLKDAKKTIDDGKSIDEYFKETLVGI